MRLQKICFFCRGQNYPIVQKLNMETISFDVLLRFNSGTTWQLLDIYSHTYFVNSEFQGFRS